MIDTPPVMPRFFWMGRNRAIRRGRVPVQFVIPGDVIRDDLDAQAEVVHVSGRWRVKPRLLVQRLDDRSVVGVTFKGRGIHYMTNPVDRDAPADA